MRKEGVETVKPHRGTHNSAEKRVRERNGVHSSSSSFSACCVCVSECKQFSSVSMSE